MAPAGKVLVIAADDAVRDSLSLLLHQSGFVVSALASCGDLSDAIDLSGRSCLVVDVDHEDGKPFKFLDRMRLDQPHIPIVLMSSQSNDRRVAKRHPFAAVLEKPVLGGDIVAAVRAAIARFGH